MSRILAIQLGLFAVVTSFRHAAYGEDSRNTSCIQFNSVAQASYDIDTLLSAIQFDETKLPKLFQSLDNPLRIQLVTDTTQLFNAGFNGSVSGELNFRDPNGSEKKALVSLRQRGNQRRTQNRIKPLDMEILEGDSNSKADSLFPTSRSFDLVPHPWGNTIEISNDYNQNILKEFYYYRLSNILNDNSRLARLVWIDYMDKDKDKGQIASGLGILLEGKKAMAKRLGMAKLEKDTPEVTHATDEGLSLANFSTETFEHIMGNTDYSFNGAHNLIPLQPSDSDEISFTPYDFDHSQNIGLYSSAPHVDLQKSILGSLYKVHQYYENRSNATKGRLSDSQGLQQLDQAAVIHTAALNSLRRKLKQIDQAKTLVTKLEFKQETRRALLDEIDRFRIAATSILSQYSDYRKFRSDIMNPRWISKNAKSERAPIGQIFYAEIGLASSKNLKDFNHFLDLITEQNHRRGSLMQYWKKFKSLNPTENDLFSLLRSNAIVETHRLVLDRWLEDVSSAQDFISVVKGLPYPPSEAQRRSIHDLILEKLDRFYKLHPSDIEIGMLKNVSALFQVDLEITKKGIYLAQNSGEFIAAFTAPASMNTPVYSEELGKLLTTNFSQFQKFDPNIQDFNLLKKQFRSVEIIEWITQNSLEKAKNPADFIKAISMQVETPSNDYKKSTHRIITEHIKKFSSLNPTAKDYFELKKAAPYASTVLAINAEEEVNQSMTSANPRKP